MTSLRHGSPRVDLLRDVADDLEALVDPSRSVTEAGIDRDIREVVSVIRNFVVPRLDGPKVPFKVAFTGPTGGGKSTLVNSVVGRRVTRSGPLRPTTVRPLLYTSQRYASPDALGSVDADMATGDAPILKLISLIDTPDIDSTNEQNHGVALDVVAGADLVVFVASSLRYADLVPWDVLRFVARRGVPIINVLNRVTSETAGAVIDYRRRLREAGMESDVVTVMEHRMGVEGILPLPAVQSLRDRILRLASELDHGDSLARSIESVRSDLSAIAYKVNADLVRVERVADRIGTGMPDGAAEARQMAQRWDEEIAATTGVLRSIFSRQAQRARLGKVMGEIREALISLLEQDLRIFATEKGRLVIDLSDPNPVGEHLEQVDTAVSGWLDGLGYGADAVPLSSERTTARLAVAGFRAILDPAEHEPDEDTKRLRSAIAHIYSDLGERIVSSTHGGKVLEVVQRASARIRPEPALSRITPGW